MNTFADNAHRTTSHFSWQKLALLKRLAEVWRELRADPPWKYERLSPVRLLEKSELRRLDNDELARASWFWRRRPGLLPVVSSIVWLIVALGLPLWLFIVPVIGVPLLIVAPVIVNTDILQSPRWRRQYELSIDRLIRTSANDRDTSGGVEALLIDTVYLYAELGAIELGIPYIHVSNALYYDYSGYTPLCIYGWPYEETEQAIARNQEGVERFARMLEKDRAGIERYAERAGLKIDWDDPGFTLSPLASITQVPRAFDFESSHWPSKFYHTGPFHDGMGRTKVDFPWDRLTGEPLIYASIGTVLNGNLDVFQTIVTALTKHNDLQLVLSVGDQVDPQRIVSAPKNAIIVQRAPQPELLKLASVCITHAGLNTVLESLAQGVPQVAIPVTFDQPGVAARIAHRETGVVTSLDKLTPDHLSELLDEVLINSTYRTNAQKLQRKIVEANGLSVAADVIEKELAGRTPNAL